MTSTDLALPTGGTLAARPSDDPLAGWLAAAADAQTLAQGLVRSFFVPAAYKPNPREDGALEVAVANATGAILLGRSLGLDPLTSLQQIYVVHGRPGMYTKLKVALAQAAGHRVWDEVYAADRAVVCGQRKGTEDVVRIEITLQMAKDAGWLSNDAYRKTPADMLWARAAARVVDRIAADLLMGVRSIEDIEPDEAPVEPAPRVTATAILAQATPPPAPASAEEPRAEQVLPPAAPREVPPEPVVERMVLPVSKGQLDALKTRFEELNLGGRAAAQRAARMRVLSELVAREIDDPRALTNDEAKTCLDNLAGANGLRVCLDLGVLVAPDVADEHDPAGEAIDAARTAQAEGAEQEADPYATYDPSLEMDGAEAAAEGS